MYPKKNEPRIKPENRGTDIIGLSHSEPNRHFRWVKPQVFCVKLTANLSYCSDCRHSQQWEHTIPKMTDISSCGKVNKLPHVNNSA